jgi:hypothetical protein
VKTLVITDRLGEIVGLVCFGKEQADGAPEQIQLEPLEGQQVYEIELPPELKEMDSVLDLYKVVEREYTFDAKAAQLTRKG